MAPDTENFPKTLITEERMLIRNVRSGQVRRTISGWPISA